MVTTVHSAQRTISFEICYRCAMSCVKMMMLMIVNWCFIIEEQASTFNSCHLIKMLFIQVVVFAAIRKSLNFPSKSWW